MWQMTGIIGSNKFAATGAIPVSRDPFNSSPIYVGHCVEEQKNSRTAFTRFDKRETVSVLRSGFDLITNQAMKLEPIYTPYIEGER